MSTTLPLFWDLSSADKKKRLDASVKLICTLERFQVSFEHQLTETDASSDEDDHPGEENAERDGTVENMGHDSMLDVLNATDVAYSVRRLIRGLASPRESSRLGFAVALTEVRTKLRVYLQVVTEISRAAFPCDDDYMCANPGAPP
jgi:DNA polymerase phi